ETISLDQAIHDAIESAKRAGDRYKFTGRVGNENAPYIPYTTKNDTVHHWTDANWKEDISFYTKAKEKMDDSLAAAKRKLELMIQATKKISCDSMKERGRFDSKRLV